MSRSRHGRAVTADRTRPDPTRRRTGNTQQRRDYSPCGTGTPAASAHPLNAADPGSLPYGVIPTGLVAQARNAYMVMEGLVILCAGTLLLADPKPGADTTEERDRQIAATLAVQTALEKGRELIVRGDFKT